jgi:hypothetical protein
MKNQAILPKPYLMDFNINIFKTSAIKEKKFISLFRLNSIIFDCIKSAYSCR